MKTRSPMTRKDALDIVGGLSTPSKMPCYGYSIPAEKCITGSKLRNQIGTTCSKCYARKGFYIFENARRALAKRFASLKDPRWVDAMIMAIGGTKNAYFRWHDSGDLQGVWHLDNICQVARSLFNVRFWIPTKEHKIVQRFVDKGGEVPPNLVIRFSALKIDVGPPECGFPTSTVHTSEPTSPLKVVNSIPAGTFYCPAPLQDNKCGDCRACWDPSVKNVSYGLH